MSLSALRSVGDAIDATREFLIPVSLRRWGALAVVVAFMGTAGTPVPASPQFFDPRLWRGPPGTQAPGEPDLVSPAEVALPAPSELPPELVVVLAGVAAVAVLYAAAGVLARFVLVEALRSDEVAPARDARRHLGGTARVLAFRLVLGGVAGLVALGAVAAVTPFAGDPLPGAGAWIASALAGAAAVILWIVDAVTVQFVVPVMVHEGRGVIAGWRRLGPTLASEWVEYTVYGIVRLVVGVAVGIVAALALIVVLLALALAFGTVAGGVVLLAGGIGAVDGAALWALVAVALGVVLSGIVAFALINVPFQCYLWYYALLVLGDTDPELDLIPASRAAVRERDRGPTTA